ncbi:cytochrome c biogenesis CcdA family protein [Paenirhodobacter enshiensis]|uniref:Cytochrome C biogenesis protein n=1 Tax=Paenirhodobacter enshiensis TaxID=1105367 RepID=A0A086XQE5_9RHOB|nr:cytochrome c biogenesis protein CcdA [Paenirhodobacter enshiensis]KFI24245.1 cytochrome C biogenesis protein [Paenirhodobacter enshiensis]
MFGTDLILDASFLPAVLIALVAGVLSFLSPCVLPIVPPYLAFMGGVGVAEMAGPAASARRKALWAALCFVLGLSTVFLLLGMSASALGRALGAWQDWLTRGAALLIMVFGAHFVGAFRIGFLDREARFDGHAGGGSALGAYLLGLAFAFGWTPCLGPVLAAILSLAAAGGGIGRGAVLLAAYAAGLGLPFLAVAAFFPQLRGFMGWMRRHMGRIEKISGLLLWTVGLMMLTGQFQALAFWLIDTFPVLGAIG